jgi:hypothetical protein
MRQFDRKLAIAATATALAGAIGASVAQGTQPEENDSTVQKVEVNGSGQQIYFFRDQGNSAETDPAAHLMLIKHEPEAAPVAQTTTSTTVAQATATDNAAVTTTMPAASDTSNTETGAATAAAAAPADNTPALAPKADRN